jgi:GNAT superfamily N-acetyltransferase
VRLARRFFFSLGLLSATAGLAAATPRIFLVKDIHQNLEAQRRIADILLTLSKQQRIVVGVEGASGFLNYSSYWHLADQDRVRAVATRYLQNGAMNASSYAALARPNGATYWGVENPSSYRANVSAYLDAVSARPLLKAAVSRLVQNNAADKRRYLSSSVRAFDARRCDFLLHKMTLKQYVAALIGTHRDAAAAFAEAIGTGDLSGALERCEAARLRSLGPTDLDRYLLGVSHRLELMNKLVDFELTHPEWEEWKALGVHSAPLKNFEYFYEWAERRNDDMFDRMAACSKKADVLVLVVGGFHADGLRTLFAKHHISCQVLTPRLKTVETVRSPIQCLSVFLPARHFLAAGDGIALHALLVPTVNAGDQFRAELNMITIRPYQVADRDEVRAIALATAFHGEPFQAFFKSGEWLADYLMAPYTEIEPEHLFVAEFKGQVVGYLTGVLDSLEFRHKKYRRIYPKLAWSFWTGGVWIHPLNWRFAFSIVANVLKGRLVGDSEDMLAEYPAHMHINVRDGHRQLGIGRRLLDRFVDIVQDAGVSGIHLHTMREEDQHPFFEAVGFSKLASRPFTAFRYLRAPDMRYITYGMKVADRAA